MSEKQNIIQEIYRKLFHILSTSTIALSLFYFGKNAVLPWFISLALILPLLDYGRNHFSVLRRIFIFFFAPIIRPIEYRILTGASWVVIGAAIATLICNEKATIIGLLVLSISDSIAAIIGIRFGKTQLFNKSLEGTTAFFISASLIIFSLSPSLFIINLCAIIAATLIELFSTPRFNDNLFIPLTIALILTFEVVI